MCTAKRVVPERWFPNGGFRMGDTTQAITAPQGDTVRAT